MPYRFALSREQRSTLPLVDSFLPVLQKTSIFFRCQLFGSLYSCSFLFSFLSVPERKFSKTSDALMIDRSWRNPRRSIHHPFLPTDFSLSERTCAFQLRRSLATPTFPVDPSPTSAPCSLAMFARCTARSLTYSWVYGTINPLRDSIITEAIKHLNV